MTGAIYSGTYVTGIVLSDPTTQLPATVTGSVSNQDQNYQNGDAIYGKPGARWTVVNSGTIQSTGTAGYGIDLAARGTVENGVSGATAALIAGYGGVLIRGTLATVANYATIEATGGKRNGVELGNGGRVTNGGTGATTALISGGKHAVVIRSAAGTVRNFGTLTSTGTYNAVALFAGGSVTNGSNASTEALISASASGVYVDGAVGTVANFGTIEGGRGVALRTGGRVTNGSAAATAALISGTRKGIYISGIAGTVTNFGTIQGTGGGVNLLAGGTVVNFGTITSTGDKQAAVRLMAGGNVTNGSAATTGALISGTYEGVYIGGAAGTVTNFGTIQFGTIQRGSGVALLNGGRVTNGGAAATRALMGAVYIAHGAGTVSNFGTIDGGGYSVRLTSGGRVTNGSAATSALIGGVSIAGAAGAVTNFGTIDGRGYSVRLTSGGGITNGSAASTSAQISGVYIAGAAGTVSNFGTIDGAGVFLRAGGKVTNGSTAATRALVSSVVYGVYISGAAGTVSNFGTIDGGDYPVLLFGGGRVTNGSAASTNAQISGASEGVLIGGGITGTVTNFGTISGGVNGVDIRNAAGTVTNFGTISGGQDGVFCVDVAVTNFGTISGGGVGVDFYRAGGTVTNFGTISGGSSGTAVQSAGKVVVEPASVFVGSVLGGGVSEIDFVAGGVADVSNVSGFATIALSNGRHHTLTLTGTNFAAVVGAVITVDDGNSGNTVNAAALPAKDHIIVHAGAGLDKLTGGRGSDGFFAGGDTAMTGKVGTNEFTFSAPGDNTIGDFAVSATNEVVFSDKGFSLGLTGASGTPKALPAGLFVENSDGHFTGTSQNFAYATGTGDLFYSASGSTGTPALVSHFTNAPSLAATQLFFIT